MSYNPKVIQAKVISENKNNGLFEVSALLQDRTECRLVYETKERGEVIATHISRLHREPCPICRKDFTCTCFTRYLHDIADQSTSLINSK